MKPHRVKPVYDAVSDEDGIRIGVGRYGRVEFRRRKREANCDAEVSRPAILYTIG
jgi:hypothetical protein